MVDTTVATNEIQWRRVMAAGNNKHRRGDCFFFLSKMRVAESGFQREAGEGGTKRGEEFSCLLYGIDPFGRLPTYQNGAGIKLSKMIRKDGRLKTQEQRNEAANEYIVGKQALQYIITTSTRSSSSSKLRLSSVFSNFLKEVRG